MHITVAKMWEVNSRNSREAMKYGLWFFAILDFMNYCAGQCRSLSSSDPSKFCLNHFDNEK